VSNDVSIGLWEESECNKSWLWLFVLCDDVTKYRTLRENQVFRD
jgi:hypothetical protein